MNWIFPIAGFGTRTKELGSYKPFIQITEDMNVMQACISGLRTLFKKDDTFTFISTKPHDQQYDVRKKIIALMSSYNTKVVLMDNTPPGQALTLFNGMSQKDIWDYTVYEQPSTVINLDQFVFFNPSDIDLNVPSVGIYFNDKDRSCYFDIDLFSKKVKKIKEKEKISSYASAGVFYFPSIIQMMEAIRWGIDRKVTTNGELYLSSCLDYFKNIQYFKTYIKFDLGNPNEINKFKTFWNGLKIGVCYDK